MYIYSKTRKKLFNPFEIIHKKIRERKFSTFIYVVPTRRKVRYLIRELIKYSPDKVVPHINVFTIGDLAEEIFKSKFTGWNKITSSLQFFMMKKLLNELQLDYFQARGKYISNGLVELLIAVITRLKELGISEKNFASQINQFDGYNRLKLNDISKIYSHYQQLLEQLNLYETGDIYLEINSYSNDDFKKIFRSAFSEIDYLLITGFNEFTIPELELIELLSQVNNLELNLTLDFNYHNPEVFENLFETHNRLLKIGFNSIITDEFEKNTQFHKTIKENLFHKKPSAKISSKNIYKFVGLNIRDEVEIIAKIIKWKITQNPELNLNQICIAIKGIQNYSNLTREIFHKYGIPVNVTDRFYLKNSLPVISIIRLLDLIRKDYFYEDLFFVLRSSYLDFSDIDVENLRDTLELIKITRGKDRINKAIENRINYLNTLPPDEYLQKENELEKLNKAKDDFSKFFKLLEPFEKKQTPSQFIFNLRKLIQQLHVYEKIFETKLDLNNELNIVSYSKDVRSLNLFDAILDELNYTFEKLGQQNQQFSFNQFFDFITTAVFGSRFNIKERWGYGVLVTSPDEIRGLSFKILFLPGMENGIFPAPYTPLIFLEEKYIRNERQKLLEDRYLFYQTLNAFEDELFLSYPKQDEKREKIPSDFLSELAEVCDVQEFDRTEIDQIIFSQSELFEKYSNTDLLKFEFGSNEIKDRIRKVNETVRNISYRIENNINGEGKEFCGIITDENLLKNLYFDLNGKTFSITELETYAKCPFKFFLNYILKIKTEEDIEEDIQKREFGLILHQILYRFFNKLKSENRDFYEELKTNFDGLSDEILEMAREILAGYQRFNPFFFLTEEIFLGSQFRKSILQQFLESEKERNEKSEIKFTPFEFEKSIRHNFSVNEEEFILSGKIDRIDVDEESNSFKVIDYKTGGIPEKKDHEDLLAFQLPLYLLLVEKYFQSINPDIKIYDAEFLKLSSGKSKDIEIKSLLKNYLSNSSDLHEELQKVLHHISELIQKIKMGRFNLTTIEKFEARVCRFCDYQSICRIDVIKKNAV